MFVPQAGAPHKKNAKKVYQNCSKHAQTQVRTNKCVQSFSERQQFHLWGVVSVIFVNPFNLVPPPLQKLHLTLFLESLTLIIHTLKTERLVPAGIFDQESEAQKATFLRSVEAVNDDRTILTKSLVTTDINDYPNDDSFKASKKLCEMVQSEVAGIFGPTKYWLLIITDLLLLVNFVFNCNHQASFYRPCASRVEHTECAIYADQVSKIWLWLLLLLLLFMQTKWAKDL